MQQKKDRTIRIVWPDIIKGFAIWLMVLCHSHVKYTPLVIFIYMFHMPVFFIISGFFDKGECLSLLAVQKAFQKLLIPYFLYNILGLSICWVSPCLLPELYKGIVGLPAIFTAALTGMFLMEDNITSYSFMPLGCMWFLVSLFICKVFWMSIMSCLRHKKVLLILPISIAWIIWRIKPHFFSLDSAVISLPFYAFGYLYKKIDIYINRGGKIFFFLQALLHYYTC